MPEFTDEEIEAVLLGYVECALWSSTDDDGGPFDDDFGIEDLSAEALSAMRTDVADFMESHASAVLVFQAVTNRPFEHIGHDFWLTRNGHGAGFWDRGAGASGERLTQACKPYGGSDLYVGDDGKLHCD